MELITFGVVGLASLFWGLEMWGPSFEADNEASMAVSVFLMVVGGGMIILTIIGWFLGCIISMLGGGA